MAHVAILSAAGMASNQAANPTAEEKLSLLKKAYRSLKQESERREEAMAAERAAAQRERGAKRPARPPPAFSSLVQRHSRWKR
jgi:hypothetical protein